MEAQDTSSGKDMDNDFLANLSVGEAFLRPSSPKLREC